MYKVLFLVEKEVSDVVLVFKRTYCLMWKMVSHPNKGNSWKPCWVVGSGQKLAVDHKEDLLKWGIFIHERLKIILKGCSSAGFQ